MILPKESATFSSCRFNFFRVSLSRTRVIWFFCDRAYQADKKIFFVDHEYQADLKVFFTDKEYRAGWKKNEKKHLLY